MSASLILIPLAIEWVILITTLAPLILVGKFVRYPRTGITIWFVSFLSAGLATAVILVISVWAYLDTVSALSRESFGGASWLQVLFVSFAPWLALALGGISLALINQRIEPLIETAGLVKPMLNLGKRPLMNFMGTQVSTVQLPFAYALATNKEIVVSQFAVDQLSKDELDAVLWHELCHVRENHYAIKQLARLIRELSPALTASRALVSEVERLVEIRADAFAIQKVAVEDLGSARKLFVQ